MTQIKLAAFILLSSVFSMTAASLAEPPVRFSHSIMTLELRKVVYYTTFGPADLHLRKNHRFIEKRKNSFPGANTKSKGTWVVNNDTLYLHYKMYDCKDRKWYKDCECSFSPGTKKSVVKLAVINRNLWQVSERRDNFVVYRSAFRKFFRKCRWAVMGI